MSTTISTEKNRKEKATREVCNPAALFSPATLYCLRRGVPNPCITTVIGLTLSTIGHYI